MDQGNSDGGSVGGCELELPVDLEAERVVAGTAIDSPLAASFVADLTPPDFTLDVHRRLHEAAVKCDLKYRWDGTRTKAIARAAGIPFEVAEELRRGIPVLDDRGGRYARRLRVAAVKRRCMAELVDQVNALGSGGELDVDGLERCLAVARGKAPDVLRRPESAAS